VCDGLPTSPTVKTSCSGVKGKNADRLFLFYLVYVDVNDTFVPSFPVSLIMPILPHLREEEWKNFDANKRGY
jgi:hypothetical protein